MVRWTNGITSFYQGDCREVLAELPAESIQCVVTSPPYWGLRDYGTDGQLGLEQTPDEYVANMVEVFHAVRRVLRKDGTVWLNLGDSYSSGGRTTTTNDTLRGDTPVNVTRTPVVEGIKPKDLVGIPWRVAFALQADGWYLRSDIIWSKPNPMPESVTDRPTKAHEYIFLLTKSPHYYYDADAIREPNHDSYHGHRGTTEGRIKMQSAMRDRSDKAAMDRYATNGRNKRSVWEVDTKYQDATYGGGGTSFKGHSGHYKADGSLIDNPLGRNKRDVWEITTQAYPDAHFATFPEALVKPCILAGTKEQDTVLDPFAGSGTVMQVAQGFGRNSIGVELNDEYIDLAVKRLERIPLPMKGMI